MQKMAKYLNKKQNQKYALEYKNCHRIYIIYIQLEEIFNFKNKSKSRQRAHTKQDFTKAAKTRRMGE